MRKYISDITLRKDGDNIKIIPLVTPIPESQPTEVKRVLLQKYEVARSDEAGIEGIREAIDQQAVMQYPGSNTAVTSTLFHTGGGIIKQDAILVDITNAVENDFPFLIDADTSVADNIYLYRVLNYGEPTWEYATEYVGGLEALSNLMNKEGRNSEFLSYLASRDLEFLGTPPTAMKYWIENGCFFHEMYYHRPKGSIDQHKFNKQKMSSFMNLHFLETILSTIEDEFDTIQEQVL